MSLSDNFGDKIKDTCKHKNTIWAFPEGRKGSAKYPNENIICVDCGEILINGEKEKYLKVAREYNEKLKYERELNKFKKGGV